MILLKCQVVRYSIGIAFEKRENRKAVAEQGETPCPPMLYGEATRVHIAAIVTSVKMSAVQVAPQELPAL
jgi:hypothetical protein